MANLTKSSTTLASRALHDLTMIERVAQRASRRALGRIRQSVFRAYKTGGDLDVKTILRNELAPVVAKAMAIMHVAGERRSLLMMKQAVSKIERDALKEANVLPARFDLFSDALRLIKKTLKVNVDRLQKEYSARALDVLSDLGDEVESSIRKKIIELIGKGAHVSEAIEKLNNTLVKLGVDSVAPYKLETVYRTELQTAFNAGRWIADQDPDVQEILWGYKYVTVGDDRVREEHAALDGVTLPKDDPFWDKYWPPNGWNCRCQVIPVFEERNIVKPDKIDGQIPQPDEGFAFNPGKLLATSLGRSEKKLSLFEITFNWDPGAHPRGPDGKFISAGASFMGRTNNEKIKNLTKKLKGKGVKFNQIQLKKLAYLNSGDDDTVINIPSSFTAAQVAAISDAYPDKMISTVGQVSKALAPKFKDFGVASADELWHAPVEEIDKKLAESLYKENKITKDDLDHVKSLPTIPKNQIPKPQYDPNYLDDPQYARPQLKSGKIVEIKRVESGNLADKAVAKQISDWQNGLEGGGREAIHEWTKWGYHLMRQTEANMAAGKPVDNFWKETVEDFNKALDSSPHTYQGICYRGVKYLSPSHEMYHAITTPGNVVEFTASASSSRDFTVAEEFAGLDNENYIMFRIASRTGVSIEEISNIPSEKEVVIRRNTKFKVAGATKNAGMELNMNPGQGKPHYMKFTGATIIDLEEVDSSTEAQTKYNFAQKPLDLPKDGGNNEDDEGGEGDEKIRGERFFEDDPATFLKVIFTEDAEPVEL